MKTYKFFLSCLIITVAATATLNAEAIRTDINPALRYYQAFLLAPDISEADMDYLATNDLWNSTLPARFGQIVGRYDPEFKLVRQAAESAVPCDWGIDFSEGPNTLMPGLARCKAVMVGARYRVAWHLQNSHQNEARDDLLAAFTLARNITRDGTLISVLVQIAAESIGCDIIAENYGKFTPETLQQLVQGIDAAPARGTVAASIAYEKLTLHDWLLNKVLDLQKANPGDGAKVMAGVQQLFLGFKAAEHEETVSAEFTFWTQLMTAAGNSSEGVLKLLRDQGELYEQLAAVMALPYGEFDDHAKQLSAAVKESNNPLLSQAVPAFLKSRQREFKLQVWLAMLHTAVAYRIHGDPGLLSVNDPCGQGPFAFERFLLDGFDRGFQLKSTFQGSGFPEILIFVEKPGQPFFLDGPYAGEARKGHK